MSNEDMTSRAKDQPGGQVAPLGDLQDLLVRLEAATEADRELDARIQAAITPWPAGCVLEFSAGSSSYAVRRGSSRALDGAQGCYTASLDEALALVERVLPGSDFDVCYRRGGFDNVAWWISARRASIIFKGPTPALTLMAALLKALSDQSAT